MQSLGQNKRRPRFKPVDASAAGERGGGQRFSETDRKKRLRGIFDSARHRSRSQIEALKSEGFTWFHRESATQETLQRAEIDKVYEGTVAELR
jgi:hypothetical protein